MYSTSEIEEFFKNEAKVKEIYEDVLKKLLEVEGVERPLYQWTEYFLIDVLGFSKDKIDVENIVRTIAYLQILGGGEVGEDREG